MERADLWYFSKERLERTPSRDCGIEAHKELCYRQQAANFIQDMGQCLTVSQLCINTAIVYMHRFYMFHSFTKFHRNKIAACAMFLAAKVEEQPRKMEHVLKVSHMCLHRDDPPLDVTTTAYHEKQTELVQHENIMLQTLGFVIAIDHPHTYIVKLCQLVKASKDLAQTSYFMATNSLHLTTMCLQYKPTVVACVCIHLACKWANWKIAPCSEGKEWYYYVDKGVSLDLLEELTNDFIKILGRYPSRIRRVSYPANGGKEHSNSDKDKRKSEQIVGSTEKAAESKSEENSDTNPPKKESTPESCTSYLRQEDDFPTSSSNLTMHVESSSAENSPTRKCKSETSSSSVSITLADYREKRDKGRVEQKNAHLEVPSSSLRQNAIDKHSRPLINHEKPQHPMPYIKPEFTVQRVAEKSNKQNCEFNPSTVERFNHQSARLLGNESHHQEGKFIAVKNAAEIKSEPSAAKMDHSSRDKSKDMLPHPDSTENFSNVLTGPSRSCEVEQNVTVRLPHEKRTHSVGAERTNQKLPDISLHNKVNKVKHQKHKPATQSPPQDGHGESLISQGNSVLKQSSDWDSSKSCSSKLEPCVVIEHRAIASAEQSIRVPEKTSEPSIKHERKEKHKHKHSVHSSSREKSNRNHEPPPIDQNLCGGIKITIPKDKIVLSGVRPESSQKSNLVKPEDQEKRSLKIKIPKPKIASNDAPPRAPALKLVLTKDKTAGSYSASHKPDKGSRKRDRSPKDHNSKNSESSKPSKLAKLEHSQMSFHQEGYHASASLPPEQNKVSRHFHHSEANQFSASSGNKKNSGRGYHHLNDSAIATSQYVMPYGGGGQSYYQQYSSQPQTNMSSSGYQNKMVHIPYDHTKIPPPDVPPLPKDPPPPLPPQPPPEL